MLYKVCSIQVRAYMRRKIADSSARTCTVSRRQRGYILSEDDTRPRTGIFTFLPFLTLKTFQMFHNYRRQKTSLRVCILNLCEASISNFTRKSISRSLLLVKALHMSGSLSSHRFQPRYTHTLGETLVNPHTIKVASL